MITATSINTLSARIDRDKINMTPRIDATHACIRSISAVQDDKPGAAILGIAAAFYIMAERAQMDPHQLHDAGRRIVTGEFTGDMKTSNMLEAMRDLARDLFADKPSIGNYTTPAE